MKENHEKRKLLFSQDTRLKTLISCEHETFKKLRSEKKHARILADFKKQKEFEMMQRQDYKNLKESITQENYEKT